MRLATRHGLPHPTLMRFTLKLLANLTDPRGGDAMDRLINALTPRRPGGVRPRDRARPARLEPALQAALGSGWPASREEVRSS